MDLLMDDRSPEMCRSLGLDCGDCVERAAEAVAAICRGMNGAGAHTIFTQLYSSPGCAPMAGAFESAYLVASAPRKPMIRAVAAA
jgi:hypothetical protein